MVRLLLALSLLVLGLAAPARSDASSGAAASRAGDESPPVAKPSLADDRAEEAAARTLDRLASEQERLHDEAASTARRLVELRDARARLEDQLARTEEDLIRLGKEAADRRVAAGQGLARLVALQRGNAEDRQQVAKAGIIVARLLDPWQTATARLPEGRATEAMLRSRLSAIQQSERAASAELEAAQARARSVGAALAEAQTALQGLLASRAVAKERAREAALAVEASSASTSAFPAVADETAKAAETIAALGDTTADGRDHGIETMELTRPGPEPSTVESSSAVLDGDAAGRVVLAGGLEHLPLAGRVVAGFGEAKDALRNRGVLIVGRIGEPVSAPRGGVVAFAGEFKSYGYLLIINHGDDYHTLLSGMSGLDVRRGDVVRSGQRVGTLASAADGSAVLYMELRRGGVPVDPMPALAAHEDKVRG